MYCRTKYLSCAVLLLVVGLGSDSPRGYDDAVEEDGIEGRWQAVAVENTGGTYPTPKWCMIFHAGRFSWNGRGFHPSGYYKIDVTKTPAWLDMTTSDTPGAAYTEKCIYRIDGDTLKIAWMLEKDKRSRIFDIKGDRHQSVSIYKRVKK